MSKTINLRRSSFRKKYFRSVELLALGLMLLAIGAISYLFFGVLKTEHQRRQTLYQENSKLRGEIELIRKTQGEVTQAEINTKTALEKLEEFNQRFLKNVAPGRIAIIDEINKLIKKNNLTLKSAIDFNPIKQADLNKKDSEREGERGRSDDKLAVYPGIQINFNVVGSYENFRRFLYDVESNDLFIIIESLELKMDKDKETMNGTIRGAAQNRGDTLSIQLKLRTHFRRSV